MVSKIQWKPSWLATQLCPQNDWTGWHSGASERCLGAQAPLIASLLFCLIVYRDEAGKTALCENLPGFPRLGIVSKTPRTGWCHLCWCPCAASVPGDTQRNRQNAYNDYNMKQWLYGVRSLWCFSPSFALLLGGGGGGALSST